MNIAIIPARGGSKRIPRKNIKEFAGKPMIAYAIQAAQQSELFEHVVVSTDDMQIADVAKCLGAEVPFLRPPDLSNDFTPTVPVIAHAISACADLGLKPDYVCCIYPAVPFIQTADLKDAFKSLIIEKADYCFPVTEFHSSIQRALKRLPSGKMESFFPEYEQVRTQDLELAYHDAGQFYWGIVQAWLSNPKIHQSGFGFPIPSWRVVDIDTLSDWERAEKLFQILN